MGKNARRAQNKTCTAHRKRADQAHTSNLPVANPSVQMYFSIKLKCILHGNMGRMHIRTSESRRLNKHEKTSNGKPFTFFIFIFRVLFRNVLFLFLVQSQVKLCI